MKKIIMCCLVLLLGVFCIACDDGTKKNDVSQTVTTDAVIEVGSYKQFEVLGILMSVPQGATNISFFVVNDVVAEIDFTLDGVAYTYRGGPKDLGNISGVENIIDLDGSVSLSTSFHNTLNNKEYHYDIFLRNTQDGSTLATWDTGKNTYALFTAETVDKSAMGEICEELVMSSLRWEQQEAMPSLEIIDTGEEQN